MIEVTAWRESKIGRIGYDCRDGKVFITWNFEGVDEKKEIRLSDIKKLNMEGYTSNYVLEFQDKNDKIIFKEKLLDKQDCENLKLYLEQQMAEASELFEDLKREYVPIREAQKIIEEKLEINPADFDPDKFLRFLLFQAKYARATGVHFNPGQQDVRVRFRIDGLLMDVARLHWEVYNSLLSSAKRLAGLIELKRAIPREGVFHLGFPEPLGVRLSLMPLTEGEKMILRILPFESELLKLEDLGMPPDIYERYHALLNSSKGMVLICGPAGGGKTTTIYGSLLHMVDESGDTLNISTIEDPVESHVESFCQTQVDTKSGLTTFRGLSSILRQDPDIILVGDLRDYKVGELALSGAMDEHLMFSSVQANNAPQAFLRIMEMGVAPAFLDSTVLVVLAQRLVRKVCSFCSEEAAPPEELKKKAEELGIKNITYRAGKGCTACNMTGYLGRTGVFELFAPDKEFFNLLQSEPTLEQLLSEAKSKGYNALSNDAVIKAASGLTGWEEIKNII
ncbi:MAG: Flp pilus assembly complex ATPase component TadA [Chloroflexi bacterium]|nr:Flp pilus assembly complex ATPase component TadA [Chloroflexota bacterium]